MIIPFIIGGAAVYWYMSKKGGSDSQPSKIPEALVEYMASKPSGWTEVTTTPKRIVKLNSKYLASIPAYSSNDVWGVPNGDIFDDFKARFRRKDPFLLNCSRGVFLIDPQGSNYARYVSKVG